MSGRTKWLLAVGLLAAIVVGYLLVPDSASLWAEARARLDGWRESVREAPLASVALFVALYVGVTALSLPVAAPLSMVAGALFGRWLGTGVVSVAATVGATLAFLSSRYLLREWVRARFGGRMRAVEAGIARDGAYYLLTLRLVPLFPFWLVNLAMGLTPLRVRTFAAVSWVGMLPGTFLFVNAGTAVAEVASPRDVLSPEVLGSFALLGLVPLVVRRVVRRGPSNNPRPSRP
jgi:uncharacterized membrane protein YdjX (TVP38/TMEM64 family)